MGPYFKILHPTLYLYAAIFMPRWDPVIIISPPLDDTSVSSKVVPYKIVRFV